MKTKAKINSVLEKKLEDLESLFEAITSKDNDPYLWRKLVLGIIFAKTLLTAEISSRPMDVEEEEDVVEKLKLRCMATRLSEMETFVTKQLPGHESGSLNEPVMGRLETNADAIDAQTGVVYSLVESYPNESSQADEEEEEVVEEVEEEVEEVEEEKEEEEEVEAEQWPLFQDASSEEELEAEEWSLFQDASSEEKRQDTFPAVAIVKEEEVDREVKENGRVCFKALVCFGLIGSMMGLVGLIGDGMEEVFVLTPT